MTTIKVGDVVNLDADVDEHLRVAARSADEPDPARRARHVVKAYRVVSISDLECRISSVVDGQAGAAQETSVQLDELVLVPVPPAVDAVEVELIEAAAAVPTEA